MKLIRINSLNFTLNNFSTINYFYSFLFGFYTLAKFYSDIKNIFKFVEVPNYVRPFMVEIMKTNRILSELKLQVAHYKFKLSKAI